ncbi:hypothetical protein DSO57_1029278 [Entomophthora muscae]|uniref:Uncharacterized protein n=1 Tax=Entomophthora muscae TaxID=34485 RepID=A0ACC2SQ89_9FUNG|nr:hypothetical protein DSO57_1029278 [Entomophthora muscae]
MVASSAAEVEGLDCSERGYLTTNEQPCSCQGYDTDVLVGAPMGLVALEATPELKDLSQYPPKPP